MASLSTCHLGVLPWMAILLVFMAQPNLSNLYILHDSFKCGCGCVSADVCVSFNQGEVA